MTVGELRKLIVDMPDDAFICPDWAEGEDPGDRGPTVVLRGFALEERDPDDVYLSVKIGIQYAV